LAIVRAGNVIGSGILFFGIGVLGGIGVGIGVGILGGFSLGFLGFLGFLVFLGFSRGFDIGLITTLFGISDPCRAPKIITRITMRNKQ
jgi:hypothetical protein